jgi:hypothetical protein
MHIFPYITEPPEDEGTPRYRIYGIWRHYCMDWDGLAVSEFTPEFSCCVESWHGWRGKLLPLARLINRLYVWWKWERHDPNR